MNRVAKTFGLCALSFTVLLAFPTQQSRAHDGATGIVKERMEAMKSISSAMKTITKTLKGEEESKPADLTKAARTIQQHAGEKLTRLFPEGSLDHPSEAKPEIWQDWESFEDLSRALSNNAMKLAETIEQSGTVKKATFMKVAGTCRDCHKAFRVKK